MYYFYNIPFGSYVLEIWLPNSPYPRTYQVLANQVPFSDITPIALW